LPASFTLSLKLREGAKPLELVRVAGRGSINPFLMSKYEVTQAQYAAVIGKNPSAFPSGDNYPVETVNWSEAKDFSRKLTAALTGPLKGKAVFRLPTDAEWSLAVGLPPENGSSPKEKDFGNQDAFPWGKQWPPPTGAGNYGDRAAKRKGADWTTIEGYDDGYAETSPVGTFKPNPYGLCDLGGNVWEWCEDWYDDKQENRVLRGASWRTGERDRLASSRRLDGSPEARGAYVGFRVVLAPPGPEAPQSKAR
jgi:formylglycine-generating enzyme required for sulfatase activity